MNNLKENKQFPPAINNKSFTLQLREYLLANPLDNLPSLFLLGVAAFGIVTLVSLFIMDLLVFPFVLVAIFTCLFAAWHIRILGSMKVQVERLTEENNKLSHENEKFIASNESFAQKIELFDAENKRLSGNITEIEATADALKQNNDRLHQELTALQNLRNNLQDYADETKLDFSQLLEEVNQNFKRLEVITVANERVLLQRIAQDLEFLDQEAGMQRDEYERFVRRIPEHLQDSFTRLGNTSFEQIAGDNKRVDYQEIQALVHKVIEKA
jgi:SMC interacting uncharacterized protein involved in chromosome segregation